MNNRLAFSRIVNFFALLITVLPVIHDLADGRLGIRGDFHQIQPGPFRGGNRFIQGNNTERLTLFVDDPDRSRLYFSVDL
jgi:hypothetical protein